MDLELFSNNLFVVLIFSSIGFIASYLFGYYQGLQEAEDYKIMLRRVVQALDDLIKRHNLSQN